jgi:hypothetical protein
MDDKNFRRLYVTVDDDVMVIFGLDPKTVTATELRQRLREIAVEMGGVVRKKPRVRRKDAGRHRTPDWELKLQRLKLAQQPTEERADTTTP